MATARFIGALRFGVRTAIALLGWQAAALGQVHPDTAGTRAIALRGRTRLATTAARLIREVSNDLEQAGRQASTWTDGDHSLLAQHRRQLPAPTRQRQRLARHRASRQQLGVELPSFRDAELQRAALAFAGALDDLIAAETRLLGASRRHAERLDVYLADSRDPTLGLQPILLVSGGSVGGSIVLYAACRGLSAWLRRQRPPPAAATSDRPPEITGAPLDAPLDASELELLMAPPCVVEAPQRAPAADPGAAPR